MSNLSSPSWNIYTTVVQAYRPSSFSTMISLGRRDLGSLGRCGVLASNKSNHFPLTRCLIVCESSLHSPATFFPYHLIATHAQVDLDQTFLNFI
ncbi:hypothetical protein KC357_g224 [Hortaea werneckii]|nr:hypothetical protein KC357_g224 [Hortaea werneckii]